MGLYFAVVGLSLPRLGSRISGGDSQNKNGGPIYTFRRPNSLLENGHQTNLNLIEEDEYTSWSSREKASLVIQTITLV